MLFSLNHYADAVNHFNAVFLTVLYGSVAFGTRLHPNPGDAKPAALFDNFLRDPRWDNDVDDIRFLR